MTKPNIPKSYINAEFDHLAESALHRRLAAVTMAGGIVLTFMTGGVAFVVGGGLIATAAAARAEYLQRQGTIQEVPGLQQQIDVQSISSSPAVDPSIELAG